MKPLTKERLANFINRHRFVIGYGIMIVSSLFLLPALSAGMQGDVNLYQGFAKDFFNGKLPYRDRVVEYPPYAIPIFLLPRLFGEENYLDCFLALAFVADWLVKLLLFSIGLRHSKTGRALLPLLLYCLAIPFLRFFFLQRYDVFPALICLAAIWLFCSRRYAMSGLAIAIGIGVKLYPAVFVPPMFVLAVRQNKWKSSSAGLAVGLLPMALLSFFLPWWRFAEFHTARGLQVESLYASVLWLGKLLGLTRLNWVFIRSWFEINGVAATAVLPWARMIFIGAVGISTAFVIWVAARCEKLSAPRLARLLLVPLLAFVAFNQVLSPQFMIWLLPLAALASLEGNLTPALMIAIATMLTPIIFPSLHHDYGRGLDLVETIILLLRNVILVTVWLALVRESFWLPRCPQPKLK